MFLEALVSLFSISNFIKSESNISVSGAVKFLVVIILLVRSFALEPNHLSSMITFRHVLILQESQIFHNGTGILHYNELFGPNLKCIDHYHNNTK